MEPHEIGLLMLPLILLGAFLINHFDKHLKIDELRRKPRRGDDA